MKKNRNTINTFKFCLLTLLTLMIASCENGENTFDDFRDADGNLIKNVYFPIQYPVRTISLNEFSRLDNSMDLNRSFSIGAAVGGYYPPQRDNHTVFFELAEDLTVDALINGNPLLAMPSNYYTLSDESEITISEGDFHGTVTVNLTDDFFNDPLAVSANYVIPLRITGTSRPDVGVLFGEVADGVDPVVADPRVSTDWAVLPKDFTLFAVKFANRFDGQYLHYGQDRTVNGPGGLIIETDTYQGEHLEDNFITIVSTTSLNQGVMQRVGRDNSLSLMLTINDGNSITISAVDDPDSPIISMTGSGQMLEPGNAEGGAESWGGQEHITMRLAYEYAIEITDPDTGEVIDVAYHEVNDVLVYRNDGIVYEEFVIELVD